MSEDKPTSHATLGKLGATTTIGPTITIRGKLQSGEDLVVKGRIDAQITSSKALFLENSGIVRANMNVASARISGVLLGDVNAATKVEIAADGRMIGDVLAPRIVIQDGAAFRGKIDMPNFDADPNRAWERAAPQRAAGGGISGGGKAGSSQGPGAAGLSGYGGAGLAPPPAPGATEATSGASTSSAASASGGSAATEASPGDASDDDDSAT